MFDDSDGEDSGSEFFDHGRKRSHSLSGSSSGSESDAEIEDGGLLARQLREQAHNASAAMAVRRPITMVMASAPVDTIQPPAKSSKPSLLPPPPGPMIQRPLNVVEGPLQMKQGAVLLGHAVSARDRDPEGPPHICFQCNMPIAIYGKLVCGFHHNYMIRSVFHYQFIVRLAQEPCSHVLCASCAKSCTQCPRCKSAIKSFVMLHASQCSFPFIHVFSLTVSELMEM